MRVCNALGYGFMMLSFVAALLVLAAQSTVRAQDGAGMLPAYAEARLR